MVVLDFFIVNVALPSIQSELHASAGSIEWVVAGYALTSAVFLITGARLGDRFGRRRIFAAGLALFTIASAACGAAATPTELVLARLVQGVSAALLMPNVLSIITVLYSGEDRAKRARMLCDRDGPRGGRRAADRRRADRRKPGRARLALRVPDQRADRSGGAACCPGA